MAKIGFVGLGHMGKPMSLNLLKKGHQLKVYDLVEEVVNEVHKEGATRAHNLKEVAEEVDYIITMLPEGKHVKSVYLGNEGLVALASKSIFFVECSTIDIETARLVANEAESKGHQIVDAPVSGGVKGAENATLTFMVGGKEKDFQSIRAILEVMGKNIFYTGGHGTGQAAKICNNLMLAIHMIGTSEGFALAQTYGLAPEKLFEIAAASSGQSWSLTSYCPVPGPVPTSPANFGYKAGFTAQMMLKDLKIATENASSIRLPLGNKAKELYEEFCTSSKSQLDFSGIFTALSKIK